MNRGEDSVRLGEFSAGPVANAENRRIGKALYQATDSDTRLPVDDAT